MKKTALIAAFLIVLILTLIPAIVDGNRRFRWGPDTQVAQMAERINNFPRQIGDWEAESEFELSKTEIAMLQPVAAIHRSYRHPTEQQRIHLFILLGPTGPTAVHTPDICFNSRDYRRSGETRTVPVNTVSKSHLSTFESRDVSRHYLKSWYAWTVDDGTWHASSRPRYEFAGSPFLVKIQIVARYPDRVAMDNDESVNQFVDELEQTLRKELFEPMATASRSPATIVRSKGTRSVVSETNATRMRDTPH